MTDIQTHLSKIRSDAAECILLSGLATDDARREMFVKTAQHLNLLAFEIEKTIAANSAKSPHGESVTLVPLAHEEAVTTDIAAVDKHAAGSGDPEKAVDADIAAAHHKPAARPRRMLPWLLVIVLGGIVCAFLWANKPVKDHWTLLSTLPSKLFALQSTHEAASSPQDDAKQALATVLSEEQADRKRLSDQIGALSARIDNLVTALGNLQISRGEVAGPPNKIGVEDQAPIAEPKSVAPETKPVYREQNNIPAPEAPAAAKQSGGVSPPIGSPESVDRVGAIAVAPRRAELEPRKPSGPVGCMQFRSFDPVSGTYTTLDGRRRECHR
jgi:hypothetical protein